MRRHTRIGFVIVLGAFALLAAIVAWRELRQCSLDSALITAIKYRHTRRAIDLLNQGANANATDTHVEASDLRSQMSRVLDRIRGRRRVQPGRTALFLLCAPTSAPHELDYRAASTIDIDLLKALLKHGASVNTVDSAERITPLQVQCMAGNAAGVKVLLDDGADPNTGGFSMPLEFAVSGDDFAVAKLLLDYGARINASGERGFTPLNTAAVFTGTDGNGSMIDFLVAHGAYVDGRDARGDTPLCTAVYFGPAPVRCLLKHGADPFLTNSAGRTPLSIARSRPTSFRDPAVEQLLASAESAAKRKRQQTNLAANASR